MSLFSRPFAIFCSLRLFAATTLFGLFSAVSITPVAHAETPVWESGKAIGYQFDGLGPYVRARLGLSVGAAHGLPDVMAEIEPMPITHGVYSRDVFPAYGLDGTRPMPSIYMAHVSMEADGHLYARAELHARVKRYSVRFPYAPQALMLEVGLNNGRTARQSARLGKNLPLRYEADLRAGVADTPPGVSVDATRTTPQVTNLFYACQVPAKGTQIKHIQLWIGRHPVFAPEGPLLLADTHVDAATRWFSLYNHVYLELPKRGPWQDSQQVEFTVTCETQDGLKLTGVTITRIPRYATP